MSNTPTTRKPYRKAPPQHRENRREPPVFRDELDGTAIPPELSQVTEKSRVPRVQHTRFSQTDTIGRADVGVPQSVKNSKASGAPFSPLWSQDSSSEREDVLSPNRLDIREVSPLDFCQQSGEGDLSSAVQGLTRSVSTTEKTAMTSVSEDENFRQPVKSRSQGRSLVFKEPAQILVPRGLDISQIQLPRKGILKQTNMLGVQVESLRKARSAETLAQNTTEQLIFPSQQISKGQKDIRVSTLGKLSPQFSLTQDRHQGPGAGIIEEKLKFSKFLDEITYRVLSPHNFQLVGPPREKGQMLSHSLLKSSQDLGPELRQSKREMREARGDELVKSSGESRNVPERRRNSMDSGVESRKGWQDMGRPTSRRPIGKQFIARKDKMEKRHCTQRDVTEVQRESVDRCQSTRKTLEASGEGEQKKTRLGGGNKEDGFETGPEYKQPHYLETGVGQKDIAEKCRNDLNSSLQSDQDRHLAALQMASILVQNKDPLSDEDRIKQLQQQNEELLRKLSHTTNKLEMMETDFESSRHYLEAELSHAREEMDKLKDKFRRLQNSYTASQRANQELEDKLQALVKKAELERKTLDWEIVELTNKLLDSKSSIDKLEELNERYRQDCNLAVQLLKCNKSHFRNHKFADLPFVLQEMVNKHLESSEQVQSGQEPTSALASSDVVPTSVIARILEKPEPLILNSAKSSSGNQLMAEDVFVHVDMSSNTNGIKNTGKERDQVPTEEVKPQNGVCKMQTSTDSTPDERATFEKLNPYPTPPQNLFPGRKAVIEFSSDDKVKIPKDSPLPNCTYATRQAISLSLVQGEDDGVEWHRTILNSPLSDGGRSGQISNEQYKSPRSGAPRTPGNEFRSAQSSPFNSPPQVPSAFASSTSSEEDLLANWQRMFVEKVAPTSETVIAHRTSFSSEMILELQNSLGNRIDLGERRLANSDGEESGHSCSFSISRDSSLDTDSTESKVRKGKSLLDYGSEFSREEEEQLLHTVVGNQLSQDSPLHKQKEYGDAGSGSSSMEEREVLLHGSQSLLQDDVEEIGDKPTITPGGRQQRSPKRMGVHHLLRKDSLTRAQEQGTLLD